MNKVIIIGVGGLSCAHELAERGYEVHVYEARASWGGKARSQPVADTGTGGRADLPSEHGFCFYPRFYKHVIDLMERTPVPGGTVAGRLKATTESAIGVLERDASAAARVRIWPLAEPAACDRWKRLDAALYRRSKPHLFELLHIDNAFVAADILRRFATITGLARLDDLLDEIKLTTLVEGLLQRIGIDG
jgi:uncharacterized protein with NAD-binding domain and iron-sulfur cluster